MKMTEKQSTLINLTMMLDLRAKEYNMLCKDLETFKKLNIDPNDDRYVRLLDMFEKNNAEIQRINEQIKLLNNK